MEDPSGEFSDGLEDDFEESIDEKKRPPIKSNTAFKDKPYDEAYELSQDLSMAESFDGRDKNQNNPQKEKFLKNHMYDEAVEVSQSIDQSAMNVRPQPGLRADAKAVLIETSDSKNATRPSLSNNSDDKDAKGMSRNTEGTRSQSLINNRFDEALEFSQSGSEEESFDTSAKNQQRSQSQLAVNKGQQGDSRPTFQQEQAQQAQAQQQQQAAAQQQSLMQQQQQQQQQQRQQQITSPDRKSSDSASDDGEHEESYDHVEGSYNPRDYQHLNVTSDVRELFMYIERYKLQEVDLDTPLRCFIPEYIPAIGELDPFLKIPRPDGKDDGSGLKYLDEPASNQSDPTVLELQLRAKSKKLQYSDVAVRSIEHADKNPSKIEKWIQDINDLHRTKPPPHVNYRRNMPDIDRLMEVWPEDFEKVLANASLPSPDLDLSLAEFSKVLCSILDIPVYDNPIESLHLMFSLFIEFKNNPHFQGRIIPDAAADGKDGTGQGGMGSKYGGADVLEIDNGSEYKY
jgi:intraflagellar transport protein 46